MSRLISLCLPYFRSSVTMLAFELRWVEVGTSGVTSVRQVTIFMNVNSVKSVVVFRVKTS